VRIAWLSHTGGSSAGAELAMLEAVSCLTERQVEVVGIVPAHGPLSPLLKASGATVVAQHNAWWATPGGTSTLRLARQAAGSAARNVGAFGRMSRLLQEIDPDLVVTNTLAIPLGAFAARRSGLPHVWYRHEFGRRDHGFRFHFGERATFAAIERLSDRVIVNSRSVLEDAPGRRFRSKARLVTYAVTVPPHEPHDGPRDGPLRLVQIGRIAPSKGHKDAVHAGGELRRRGIDVEIRFVGPTRWPRYIEELHALAGAEGVGDLISITGFRPDPAEEVIQADVALTCSRLEAFGRTTVEAMKLGKAVIGARSAGTAELIRDGETGFTYAPGDAAELASKIELFARDRSLAPALGANAKSWAGQTFTADRYASELMEVFQEALAERRVGGRDGAARRQRAG
jgi:glycosyltransferase involved in cell wall biosynthesis